MSAAVSTPSETVHVAGVGHASRQNDRIMTTDGRVLGRYDGDALIVSSDLGAVEGLRVRRLFDPRLDIGAHVSISRIAAGRYSVFYGGTSSERELRRDDSAPAASRWKVWQVDREGTSYGESLAAGATIKGGTEAYRELLRAQRRTRLMPAGGK